MKTRSISCAPRWALSALSAASFAALAQTAPADAPAPEPAATLGEVRGKASPDDRTEGRPSYRARKASTATRLSLSPRETPQSLSVITRTQIDDFGLRNANQVLSITPGLHVERVETDRTYFSARGFDVSNFQVDGLGLPFATGDQLGDIDTAPYDRVEVLRGANGLMSSTGNPSATINFVRKRPTAELQASGGLTLGSWSQRRVDAELSSALNASRSVRGRLVLAHEKRDSHLDRYALEKNVAAGLIEMDLGDRTLLTAGHQRQHNRPNSPLWGALPLMHSDGTPVSFDRSTSTSADWAYWNANDGQSFAELSHELASGWRVQGQLTHRRLSSDGQMFYVYGEPDPVTGLGSRAYPSAYQHIEEQWVGDVHATGPFTLAGRRHELVLGANTSRSHTDMRSGYGQGIGTLLPAPLDAWDGQYPKPTFDAAEGTAAFTDRRHSLYATARWSLSDPLKLITGMNLTRVEAQGLQYGVPRVYGETELTPFVGLVYDLDPVYSLYGSVASIFNPQKETDVSGATLSPIDGRSLEAGVKAEWLDKRLIGSFAVFRVEQNHAAAADRMEGGQQRYKPVDAHSQGFEAELSGEPAPGWSLTAGYAQFSLKEEGGTSNFSYVPRKTLRVASSYRLKSLPALKLGADLKWQDDISRSVTTSTGVSAVARQPAYALLGLMARYELSRQLSVTANLDNVTDETYRTSLKWVQSPYGAPRHGSVTLNWTY